MSNTALALSEISISGGAALERKVHGQTCCAQILAVEPTSRVGQHCGVHGSADSAAGSSSVPSSSSIAGAHSLDRRVGSGMQVLDSSRSDRDGATSVFGLVSLGQPSDLRDSMRLIDHGLQDSGSAGPLANAEAPPVPISAPTAARPAGEKSARGDGSALGLSALGLTPA